MVDDYGPCRYSTLVELCVNCRAAGNDLLRPFNVGAGALAVSAERRVCGPYVTERPAAEHAVTAWPTRIGHFEPLISLNLVAGGQNKSR